MKKRGLLIAAISLTSLAPATAFGQDQPWLADRRFTVGPGYRVGDYELHPGVAVEFGYDSNFFLRASEGDAPGEPVGAMRLRVTPSFSFSTLGPQRKGGAATQAPPTAEFSGGLSVTYNEFFPVSGPQEGKDRMWEQRNLSGLLDMRLNLLPTRPWSGSIYASVGRLIQATQEGVVRDGVSESYNRFTPNAGAEARLEPEQRPPRLAHRLQLRRHGLRIQPLHRPHEHPPHLPDAGPLALLAALGAPLRRPRRHHPLPRSERENGLDAAPRAARLQRPHHEELRRADHGGLGRELLRPDLHRDGRDGPGLRQPHRPGRASLLPHAEPKLGSAGREPDALVRLAWLHA